MIADRLGLKKVFLSGLVLFTLVYAGMGINTHFYLFFVLFFLYGVYAAATEGISKAWISNITDRKDTATAIGTFTGFQSICALMASSFAGLIWFNFGARSAFMATSVISLGVIVYISALKFPHAAAGNKKGR